MQWQPISLLKKNNPEPGSQYHTVSEFSHGLLRVMESVRAAAADPATANRDYFRMYWEFASKIHHDGEYSFDITAVLETLGIDTAHAAAATDESWDAPIAEGMANGLSLVGDDVGTPIIATERSDGAQVGYFGPVITQVPRGDKAAALWDALMVMMDTDGFFELKKTRQEMPNPGERPEPMTS